MEKTNRRFFETHVPSVYIFPTPFAWRNLQGVVFARLHEMAYKQKGVPSQPIKSCPEKRTKNTLISSFFVIILYPFPETMCGENALTWQTPTHPSPPGRERRMGRGECQSKRTFPSHQYVGFGLARSA